MTAAEQKTKFAFKAAFLLGFVALPASGFSSAAFAQVSASPHTTAHRYDFDGRETGQISPDSDGSGPLRHAAVRKSYDQAGRLVLVEVGELNLWQSDAIAPANWSGFTVFSSVAYTYNPAGQVLTEKRMGQNGAAFALVQQSYNNRLHLECIAVRMDPTTYSSLPANACLQGSIGTHGKDRITKNTYDASGRILQVRKAIGTNLEQAYVTYSYTPNGKKEFVIDSNGNRAKLEYDAFDRQVKWIFPSQTRPAAFNPATPSLALASAGAINAADFEQYGYDANGNRTSLRKRDGSVLTFQYDALNRVTSKTVPERAGLPTTHTRDVFYGYDLRGLMTYSRFDSAGGEGVTTSYDGFGRVLSSTLAMDGASHTLTYQYDIGGNRTRVTFPDGNFATYSYDGLDRPLTILRSGTATIASYTYDAAGRRTAFNGGVSTSYGYDAAGRLNSLTNNLPATAYNNQWTFAYNPASQITQTVRSNDTFAWTAHVNVDRPYATNGLNQYSTAGPATFGYDPNGNLTSDGSTTFLYDIENRLVSASGAKTAALRYDPMGRLYEVSGSSGTTRFLYDGDALVGEYSASGILLRRYVHGADAKADDPIAWYEGAAFDATSERRLRPDWLGSIVLVTDSTGATVLAVNRYDEYGIPQSTNVGRFQYTGQAWIAELGMYHYKARIYSPTLGRFLQTDPIGYEDQVNLYAYVGNDPVNGVDPSGLSAVIYQDGNNVRIVWYVEVSGDGADRFPEVKSAVEGSFTGNFGKYTVTAEVVPINSTDNPLRGNDLVITKGDAATPNGHSQNNSGGLNWGTISITLRDIDGKTTRDGNRSAKGRDTVPHEFGHNAGLEHVSDLGNLMGSVDGKGRPGGRVTEGQISEMINSPSNCRASTEDGTSSCQ